ncbi:MAG: hypothetical protein ABW201_14925 [Candidatus Thiodiazotropha sp.]
MNSVISIFGGLLSAGQEGAHDVLADQHQLHFFSENLVLFMDTLKVSFT